MRPGHSPCNKGEGDIEYNFIFAFTCRNTGKDTQEIDENGYFAVNLSISVCYLNHVNVLLIQAKKKEHLERENGKKRNWRQ